jgi:hypothetical protein
MMERHFPHLGSTFSYEKQQTTFDGGIYMPADKPILPVTEGLLTDLIAKYYERKPNDQDLAGFLYTRLRSKFGQQLLPVTEGEIERVLDEGWFSATEYSTSVGAAAVLDLLRERCVICTDGELGRAAVDSDPDGWWGVRDGEIEAEYDFDGFGKAIREELEEKDEQ